MDAKEQGSLAIQGLYIVFQLLTRYIVARKAELKARKHI